MEPAEVVLKRGRRAYESSRLVDALYAVWPVAPLLAVTWLLHGVGDRVPLLIATALATVLVVAAWRGRAWRRGTFVGLAAGLPALITPTVVAALRGEHCSACMASSIGSMTCALACLGVSFLAGIAVGLVAASDRDARRFTGSALAVAALTGAMVCGLTGVGGAVGAAAGLVVSSVPTLLLARRVLA